MQGVPAKEAPEADMDAESRVAKPLYVGPRRRGPGRMGRGWPGTSAGSVGLIRPERSAPLTCIALQRPDHFFRCRAQRPLHGRLAGRPGGGPLQDAVLHGHCGDGLCAGH